MRQKLVALARWRAASCVVACLGMALPDLATSLAPGASAQVAAPPKPDTRILYLGKAYPQVETMSLRRSLPPDAGAVGARLALDEINVAGGFLGRRYALNVVLLPADGDIAAKAGPLIDQYAAVIADLKADDLLRLADLPNAKTALILDVRTSDDLLRQEQCRANVFHLLPGRAMRTDAIAQYLIKRRWPRWFLLRGAGANDRAYAADVQRSAARFGGRVVEEREYVYKPESRQQVQFEMPKVTAHVPDYDVTFVSDESNLFGDYLPYNTAQPRPVVGTQGLIATAWHPALHAYSAVEMQQRFQAVAHRRMAERDYAGWLAVRIVGEAVLRSDKTDPLSLRRLLRSDAFKIAGFKGQGMTFRRWDQQLRQPILLASSSMIVSISPQEGFPHAGFNTDTLGYDAAESKCHIEP